MMRIYRLVPILLVALALNGCATMKMHYLVRDFCELSPEGKAHRKDTPGTQRWFNGYRELYRRRCPQGKWH
jgi:hypothetical protein